jgi:hypothetical protein
MINKLSVVIVLAAGAASLYAQEGPLPVTLGFKVGIPVTEMFSASNTSQFANTNILGSNYTSAVPRYELGVSGEFHLPHHLRFEVDGLYKRGGFNFSSVAGTSTLYNPTSFNEWEVPALFKANVLGGHFRPFIDFGAALRHISTITQTTSGLEPYAVLSDNSSALHNRNSYGAVAGFGFTFKEGPFELTPEARYTRWANESFQTTGFRTNLDQGDVLLGIAF